MEPGKPSLAQARSSQWADAEATVLVPDRRWRGLVRNVERLAARAAGAAGGAGTVVLSSDRDVKSLNALHLRGHDHHRVGDARRMEMAEARILHRIGVPNPWNRR